MRAFKDRHGREWLVEITVGSIRSVRDLIKVDLYGLIDDRLAGMQALLRDPVRLVDVIYVLCRSQCRERSIDDIAFGESLAGESLAAAGEAFTEAFFDFFPDRGVAATLHKMTAKGRAAMAILHREADEDLDKISPESLAETLKRHAGNSPEPSASTPIAEPSPNS